MRQRGPHGYHGDVIAASYSMDDADVAAGKHAGGSFGGIGIGNGSGSGSGRFLLQSPPASINSLVTRSGHPSDLEFFEDMVSDPVLVLGVDISHLSRRSQFVVCATGNFCFSLTYGYLQELISVELANRKLGLFLAMMQFSGYTVLAYILRNFVYGGKNGGGYYPKSGGGGPLSSPSTATILPATVSGALTPSNSEVSLSRAASWKQLHQHHQHHQQNQKTSSKGGDSNDSDNGNGTSFLQPHHVPFVMYLGMSLLRAVDMGMTNLAMQYINYPAKTLMKSSKTVWTMLFGVVIARKTYHCIDYSIVLAMVAGLALFLHADASSDAVFGGMGVLMLTISLLCDGAIANMSETIMSKYGVGQDEFIFRMYSIALVAITISAAVQGDLKAGMAWMARPGTYNEMLSGKDPTWSVPGKISVLFLFSAMGFFGSSCSAAITKNFGALTMSITSTARKATTLFLSFFLFHNVCTTEHVGGIVIFITALTAKSMRRGRKGKGKKKRKSGKASRQQQQQRQYQLITKTPQSLPTGDMMHHDDSASSSGPVVHLEIPAVVRAPSQDMSSSATVGAAAAATTTTTIPTAALHVV